MSNVQVVIARAPGTNCDQETAFAFERAGARVDVLHVNQLLSEPSRLRAYQILCLPGGFSYGDDIAAGRIVAGQIRHHLVDSLTAFHDQGGLILGICNGFQILLKSGVLLPEEAGSGPPATLAWNSVGRFQDRWVHLRVSSNKCVFLQGIERMELPIAHAEGRFVARDDATLASLNQQGQLALRYADERTTATGDALLAFPLNPNGSQANVAGVCDSSGRILGLMPHPERFVDPTHHPRWTRRGEDAGVDGLRLFTNAVDYFR